MTTQSLHEAQAIHAPDSPTVLKNQPVVSLNSLEWMICKPLPVRLRDAQAVSLDDKLYVGGDTVSATGLDHDHLNFIRDASRLYVYTPESDTWKTIDTPVYWFALVTYHSQLVLVGGRETQYNKEHIIDECTNKLWTWNELTWEPLQPMNIRRYMPTAVSREDYLFVAGGCEDNDDLELDITDLLDVEVYDGSCWSTVHHPLLIHPGSSACLAGYWFLGGFEDDTGVYFASLDSLIASCTYEMPQTESSIIWKKLPNVPDSWSVIPVVFANHLIALGPSSIIYAFCFHEDSWNWERVGDLRLPVSCICALTMRSGDLIIIGGKNDDPNAANIVLKATANSQYLRSAIFGLKVENEKLKGENKKLMDQLSLSPSKPISSITAWNLRGVEVCGEMTVVVYSSHDQPIIIWEGYGLRLHIPKGCLPAGTEQCTINIKASLAGQYAFPENSHLVSAVFWFRCEDVHKFTRPITVEIQHCAKSENLSNLQIVRAVCSQKQLPYAFKLLPGGNFTSHSSYGVIELNNFSGVGVTQRGSDERNYLANLLFKEVKGRHTLVILEIFFVIICNTDAHRTVMNRYIQFKDAHLETNQPIEFESDQVEFKISKPNNRKWKVTRLNSAVVRREDVDSFTHCETSWIPHSHFRAKFHGDISSVTDLECDVDVIGAKRPHNTFTIDISPEDTTAQSPPWMPPSSSPVVATVTGSAVVNGRLTNQHHGVLVEQLSQYAVKWRDIGGKLLFTQSELDSIQASPLLLSTAPKSWLSAVLSQWLQWAPEDARGSTDFATLEALKDALRQLNLGAAAYDLHL